MKYKLSNQEVADLNFLYGYLMGESKDQFSALFFRYEKMIKRINKEQKQQKGPNMK